MARQVVALGLIALAFGGCTYMQFVRPPDPVVAAKCGVIQIPVWHSLDASQDEVYREADCIETHEAEGLVPTLPQPYFFIISSGSIYTGKPTYETR